jgi:uncharacterized protein (DUF983 family)
MSELTYSLAQSRALRLRCPRCGEGKLFRGLMTMHHHCDHCGYVFERAPGYFLGSTYMNYGFTTLSLTALYMGLHYGLDISNAALAIPLLAYCALVPLIIFRYARAWWLAMDSFFDTPQADIDEENYRRQQAMLADRARQQLDQDAASR